MTATTIREAWSFANELFPTDYEKNGTASERAGCDVYTSTLEGCSAWISDLGNRLEINFEDGTTVNIWIESDIQPTQPTQATERRETTITLESTTTAATAGETRTTTRSAVLTLSHETTLKSIAQFERDARRIVKAARAAANRGECVAVYLSKAVYHFANCDDLKQERFEAWKGYGDHITADGVHLVPDERYNNDICHDMWLTGERGELFDEMTI